jgi:hypothetical protein
MMSNSALMQSYNLMKMSSAVTKNQNTPSFAPTQDPRINEFYQQKTPIDYKRAQNFGHLRQPVAPPIQDVNDNNFLGNL